MNKTAIKNFAIWARNKLIADVSYDARLIGITEDGIAKPLPQSFGGTQFFDIGTAEPYSISGEAVRQRDKLIEVIQQKELRWPRHVSAAKTTIVITIAMRKCEMAIDLFNIDLVT